MLTLLGFVGKLAAMEAGFELAKHEALEEAAKIVETEAKRVIGTYDYGWPPLAASTLEQKANGDTPLLETGAMRDSIEHSVGKDEAMVGSNEDKAVWQELGTSLGIPPRPFLGGAAIHKEKEVHEKIGRTMVHALIVK